MTVHFIEKNVTCLFVCIVCVYVQTLYGPALELLNEIRHVALVSDTLFFLTLLQQQQLEKCAVISTCRSTPGESLPIPIA